MEKRRVSLSIKRVEEINNEIALKKAGWNIKDLELVESNEAFAAQAIAVNKELGLNSQIVNVNGGAIALGHPLGMSGARLVLTATEQLHQSKNNKLALCTMCVGVGQGSAIILEKL